MKEITKLENASLSDFKLHTEECQKAGILPVLFVFDEPNSQVEKGEWL